MTANDIIAKARAEIGTVEKYNNNVKYNTAYYGKTVNGSAYPWCAVFVWWVFKQVGASALFCGGEKSAYCPYIMSYYKSKGQFYKSPKVGDLALYDFNKDGVAEHIGIVTSVSSSTIKAIEGNTSSSNQTNGGSVQEKTRHIASCLGFARPAYTASTPKATTMSYTATVTTNTHNLNVRKGAGEKYAKVTEIAKGSTVTIDKESNGFARLAGFTEPELWVAKEWITKK